MPAALLHGPEGGVGQGTLLAQAEPLLLTSAEVLRFPGGLFDSESKRAVAGADASMLSPLWSWVRCCLLVCSGAGCVALCLLRWLQL